MADWSLLPKELLHEISTHLPTSIDLLRFRSICTSWRSSTSPIRHRFPNPFPIPIPPNDQICYDSTGFHLCKRTIFLISLPYAYPRNQTPSSWLLKIQQNNDNKHILLHPLLSAHNFPPLVLDLSKFRIRELAQGFLLLPQQPPPSPYLKGAKVVIMMLATHHHFLLLTIDFYGKLAVFISAHQQWIVVNEHMHFFYCDVILYNGKLYAVDSIGRLVVIAYVNLDLQVKLVADSVFPANQTCYVLDAVFGGLGKYLVESEEGDLLLVAIYVGNETEKSKVYRLDEGEGKWEEVKSLGDRVLFLGDDSNFSVSIDDHKFCRGNFVLFLNHSFAVGDGVEEEEDRWKVSVLDLENGCIGPLRNFPQFCNFIWPPPQWITSTTLELLEVSFTF